MGRKIVAALIMVLMLLMSVGWVSSINKTVLVKGLQMAENSVITTDGRLFVSANDAIYEIKKNSDGSFKKVKLSVPANYAIAGMAQRGKYLYANMTLIDITSGQMKSYLIAARLNDTPEFKKIYQFKNTYMTNGLTVDPDGYLYVAHSTAVDNAIIRISISQLNPLLVTKQTTWVSTGGFWPNGIRYANDSIYYTTAATLQRVEIKDNGSAGTNKRLYSKVGFNDDFYVDGQQIILTDFISGRLIQLDLNGKFVQDSKVGAFTGPSSIIKAQGSMFPDGGFLVTDKLMYTLNLVKAKN